MVTMVNANADQDLCYSKASNADSKDDIYNYIAGHHGEI